jgi:hypothetical protein
VSIMRTGSRTRVLHHRRFAAWGSSPPPDGTIVVDGGPGILHSVGTQQRYISYDGRVALGMPLRVDGAIDPLVYDAFAKRYLLRDFLPVRKVGNYHNVESAHPARPDSGVPEMPALPGNARNWILREADGTAWLVDRESRLHRIPDEPTYIRLAQMYFVRDNTSSAQIDIFRPNSPGDVLCAQGQVADPAWRRGTCHSGENHTTATRKRL